nr:MAG TPA: hypothetical protein [Caudoviricetes sp.]
MVFALTPMWVPKSAWVKPNCFLKAFIRSFILITSNLYLIIRSKNHKVKILLKIC